MNYDEDRVTQKEFLGIINQESDRLTRLVNDFLDLSNIQAGRRQWKPAELSLTEVIRAVVNTSWPLIDKAQLEVSLDLGVELPGVLSDRDRLTQVITNLLGNAIKFTPENGQITFRAWLEKAEDKDSTDMVVANITDTGIGIAREHHQTIFENFGQVGDVLKDRPKGTGLGLPICKKIIENFGGKIWVESALGQGTTMFFTLLALKNKINVFPSPAASSPFNRLAAGKAPLVVDDDNRLCE